MTPDDPDPLWPRSVTWLARGTDRWTAQIGGRPSEQPSEQPRLAVLGIPAQLTSLSASGAGATPASVRAALARFSTYQATSGLDLRQLWAVDLGDIVDPDSDAGEARTIDRVQGWRGDLLVALGGDNSITYATAVGSRADGLVTFDAHHDLRDGRSNGSPVRRLVEAGIPGERIVQIGIADFANSADYSRRAADLGITVISRGDLRSRPADEVIAEALAIAGCGPSGRVHLDIDVDVCDRAVAPACPASLPGGISAAQLLALTTATVADPRVVSVDIAEVDATADAPDQRTVRLAAMCLLSAAAALLGRAP